MERMNCKSGMTVVYNKRKAMVHIRILFWLVIRTGNTWANRSILPCGMPMSLKIIYRQVWWPRKMPANLFGQKSIKDMIIIPSMR